jgi:hypothetical protein
MCCILLVDTNLLSMALITNILGTNEISFSLELSIFVMNKEMLLSVRTPYRANLVAK